ncbi:hypothetical protein Tco_0418903 [Tanacetum coccineum]
MDDLYNNLKVYEAEIKGQSSSSLNSPNVAFVSSKNTSSNNEAVNTAHEVSTASSQGQASSSTYADDVMFSFFANQSMKIWSKFIMMILKRWISNGRKGHFARECRAPRNQGNRNEDASRRIVPERLLQMPWLFRLGIGGYDWSYQAEEGPTNFALMAHLSSRSSSLESLEARIVIHQKNEAVYEDDIAFLKYDVKVRDNSISELKNQLAEALRENYDLKLKLEKFETSSMKLTKLINIFERASDNSVNEIEEENNQVNDRFKKVEGYHAVPPPYTGNYMPSRPDLSFAGLDDFVYKTNKWLSDSDDDCVVRPSFEQNKPSYAKINFVKSDTRKSVIEQHTYRQAETP